MFHKKKITSWNSFRRFFSNFTQDWAFRGQSNSSWNLTTSLERTSFYKKYEFIELAYLAEFKRGAKNFLTGLTLPDDTLEWLALMQHHGAATRLLDFTRSPYIASYFAFENLFSSDSDYVSIWAIDTKSIAIQSMNYLRNSRYLEDYTNKKGSVISSDMFNEIFHINDFFCAFPIEPFNMNKRFFLQQALFLSPGISSIPLMEQLEFLNNPKEHVIRLDLPKSLRNEFLIELEKINITRTSLFPDLDGYAKYTTMKFENIPKLNKSIEDKLNEIQFLSKKGLIDKNILSKFEL